MDEPASSTPETQPKPLTSLQKRIYAILALLGVALIGLTFHLMDANLPGFVIGGTAGAGGSLLAIGGMMLFYRPDG